jgi:hypothetical protein
MTEPPQSEETRLKQITLIWSLVEGKISLPIKFATILAVADAAAIGTCTVVLKDLQPRFNNHAVAISVIGFVVSLIFAGMGFIYILSYDEKVRNATLKAIPSELAASYVVDVIFGVRAPQVISAMMIGASAAFLSLGVAFMLSAGVAAIWTQSN